MRPLSTRRDTLFLVDYEACTAVFSVAKRLKTSRGRLFIKSEESRHTRISDFQKETTSEQSLPVQEFDIDFNSLLILT